MLNHDAEPDDSANVTQSLQIPGTRNVGVQHGVDLRLRWLTLGGRRDARSHPELSANEVQSCETPTLSFATAIY